MRYPADGIQRSYAVFFHFRGGEALGEQYCLDVRTTSVQRAIALVIKMQQEEYAVATQDIVIDEVAYNRHLEGVKGGIRV